MQLSCQFEPTADLASATAKTSIRSLCTKRPSLGPEGSGKVGGEKRRFIEFS